MLSLHGTSLLPPHATDTGRHLQQLFKAGWVGLRVCVCGGGCPEVCRWVTSAQPYTPTLSPAHCPTVWAFVWRAIVRGRGWPLLCLGLLCSDKEPVYEPPPCPNSRLTDWLTGCLTDCLTRWLAGWLTDWTADWVSVCLTDWLDGGRRGESVCFTSEIPIVQQHTLFLLRSHHYYLQIIFLIK